MKLTQQLRRMLKKPLGKVGSVPSHLKKLRGKRIVAVGDETILKMLELGKKPHVAIFDFKIKRKRISKKNEEILRKAFPKTVEIRNPKGTVSKKLVSLAPQILKSGWAVRIAGEDDLAALPFITLSDKKTAVLYGQPGKGCVLVSEGGKEKVKEILEKLSLSKLL